MNGFSDGDSNNEDVAMSSTSQRLANGGHSASGRLPNGTSHPADEVMPGLEDNNAAESESAAGGDEADDDEPPMDLAEVKKQLGAIFSGQLSDRTDEQEAMVQLMWGIGNKVATQAALDLLKEHKSELAAKNNIPRFWTQQLARPCSTCRKMGHRANMCPNNMPKPDPSDDTASEAGTTASKEEATKAAKKTSAAKRAKKAKQAEQKARLALAAEAAAAAKEGSAGDDGSEAAARAASSMGEAESADADETADEAGGDDGDDEHAALSRLTAMVAGKAITATLPPKAPEPARSSSATASAASAEEAVPAPASAKASQTEPQQEQQQEQPDKRRPSNRRNKGGGGDAAASEQAESAAKPEGKAARAPPPAAAPSDGKARGVSSERPARPSEDSRPGSAGGQRQDRGAKRCFKCGQFGHFAKSCDSKHAVPPNLRPPAPGMPPAQQQAAPQRKVVIVPTRESTVRAPQGGLTGGVPSAAPAEPPRPEPAAPGSWAGRLNASTRVASDRPAEPASPPTPPPAPPHQGFTNGGFSPQMHDPFGGAFPPPDQQQQQHEVLLPAEQQDDSFADLLSNLGIGEEGPSAPTPLWTAEAWHPMSSPEQLHPLAQQQAPLNPAAAARAQKEDEDLQQALAASMLHTRGRPAGLQLDSAASGPAGAGPGLTNNTGEYNCFLNAIIQCVWRCEDFRKGMLDMDVSGIPRHVEGNPRIVLELHSLFRALDQDERAEGNGGERAVVSPNGLREALAQRPDFQLGEMNDASEVLRALYEALENQGQGTLVNNCFGLEVMEVVKCRSCGRSTHKQEYTQWFHNVTAAALREHAAAQPHATLGDRMKAINAAIRKTCNRDEGGCGKTNQVTHLVEGLGPRVFTLELGWGGAQEEPADIAATMAAIDMFLIPAELYMSLKEYRNHQLRAMVAYYGQHYQAFVHLRGPDGTYASGRWMLYDDARASEVGSWEDVQRKCYAGKIQPSVLLFDANCD